MEVVILSDVSGVIGFGRYGGAYRIATELRAAGYQTQVVEFLGDLSLPEFETIVDRFVDSDTLFVGFATTLLAPRRVGGAMVSRLDECRTPPDLCHLPQGEETVRAMFSMIRRRNPKTKIVVGGRKATTTTLPSVDYWVWGYADRSVLALADHLKRGSPLKTRPAHFGVAITHQDYPFRGYESAKIEWDASDHVFSDEHLPIEVDRGCIFRCAFCDQPLFKKVGEHTKSRDVLKSELVTNFSRWGTHGYLFCDDNINESLQKVESLCRVSDALPFQLEWTGVGRVDVFYQEPEQGSLLEQSGLRALMLGIESLHPVAVRAVGKPLMPELVKETLYRLKECWQDRVVVTGSFIIGLPGESEDSIWETVEWLKRADCPIDEPIFSVLSIRGPTEDPDSVLSKIAADPGKYGYSITEPGVAAGLSRDGAQWRNEYMDRTRAEGIAKKIESLFMNSRPIGNWAIYPRLRSLGYSHSDIKAMGHRPADGVITEVRLHIADLRREYFRKLLT